MPSLSTCPWSRRKNRTHLLSPREVMTGLSQWKKQKERMIFILCGAGGFRAGEALGIEIDKHISPDFLTISVKQKVHHGRVEQRLKTANGLRQVDLHPAIAALLREFVGALATAILVSYSALETETHSRHRTSSVAICTGLSRN